MLKAKSFIRKVYFKLFGAFRLVSLIDKELEDDWTILDIGCGRQSSLKEVRKGSYRVGLDMYEPYILESQKLQIHNEYVIDIVTLATNKDIRQKIAAQGHLHIKNYTWERAGKQLEELFLKSLR